MLDIRFLRENSSAAKIRLATRGAGYAELVEHALEVDAHRRSVETQLQALQAEKNRLSREVGRLRAAGQNSCTLEAQVKATSEKLDSLQKSSESLANEQRELLLSIPNLPDASVPTGKSSADNPLVRMWGEKPTISQPQDHLEIGTRLKLFDAERAAKISGSGFMVFTGEGAKLERALINFLLDLHVREHAYREVSPPLLVRRDCMVGTSQLPKFESDMYGLDDGALFLIPTAEVPITNLHRDEILPESSLPLRYVAFTPCFRREAGSTGRENRGLIRMHQFDKVELVKICRPEDSEAELESLTRDAEMVLERLGLHYRRVLLCTGDMGFGSAKTYDLEVWAPGQAVYLEVSSCSNFKDFQARRMNLRYKDADGKNRFCHTLNGSGTALARLYVAILENGLQEDGSVQLPEALEPFFGSGVIKPS